MIAWLIPIILNLCVFTGITLFWVIDLLPIKCNSTKVWSWSSKVVTCWTGGLIWSWVWTWIFFSLAELLYWVKHALSSSSTSITFWTFYCSTGIDLLWYTSSVFTWITFRAYDNPTKSNLSNAVSIFTVVSLSA